MKAELFIFILNSLFQQFLSQIAAVSPIFDKFNITDDYDKKLLNYSEKLIMPRQFDLSKPLFINYFEKEPFWPQLCLQGLSQSPLDFPSSDSSLDKTEYFQIISSNYSIVRSLYLTMEYNNTVHSIKFLGDQGHIIIRKNNLQYRYNVTEIQFHLPSEHTFDGVFGDLEMHIIHQKDDVYTQEMLASNFLVADPDIKFTQLYIAVVFMAYGSNDNDNITALKVKNLGPVLNFDLSLYTPINNPFIFYEGSTTIPEPECYENVNWVVPVKMEVMSLAQIKLFISWSIQTYSSKGNSRKTKPLNGRKVYYEYYPANATVSTTTVSNYFSVIYSLLFLLMILYT